MDEAYFLDPKNWLFTDKPLDPLQAPMGYSQAHIRDRVSQVDEMIRQVEAQISGLENNITSLQEVVKSHLWILPETSTRVFENLAIGKAKAEALRARLVTVRNGFQSLPTEEAMGTEIAQLRNEARGADTIRAAEAMKLKEAEETEASRRQKDRGL